MLCDEILAMQRSGCTVLGDARMMRALWMRVGSSQRRICGARFHRSYRGVEGLEVHAQVNTVKLDQRLASLEASSGKVAVGGVGWVETELRK